MLTEAEVLHKDPENSTARKLLVLGLLVLLHGCKQLYFLQYFRVLDFLSFGHFSSIFPIYWTCAFLNLLKEKTNKEDMVSSSKKHHFLTSKKPKTALGKTHSQGKKKPNEL